MQNSKNGSINNTYLLILDRVISCFQDEELMQVIRAIEMALLSLKSFGTHIATQSPILSSRTASATSKLMTPSLNRSDLAYQFRNSGPKTKGQIILFEGKYTYSPVFHSENDEQNPLISRLVQKLWDTRERLINFKSKHTKSNRPNDLESSESFFSVISDFFRSTIVDSGRSASKSLNSTQLNTLDCNLDVLKRIIKVLCDFWGITDPSLLQSSSLKRSVSDLALADDETELFEWAPGVFEPQRNFDAGNNLTLRGRNQVSFALIVD